MNTWKEGVYTVSDDPHRLNFAVISRFASAAPGGAVLPPPALERAALHSLCLGVYVGTAQVGWARVVTDYATFAHPCDFFVLEAHRPVAEGFLMACLLAHPELAGAGRWVFTDRRTAGLSVRHGGERLERVAYSTRPPRDLAPAGAGPR